MGLFKGNLEVAPSKYVKPTANIDIIANGVYDVADYGTANVLVQEQIEEISLPSNFSTLTAIYTFELNENERLFSSNVSNNGVWLYTKSTETFTQLYNLGYGWNNYQLLENGDCLISSSNGSTNGILYYNHTTKTIVQPFTTGYNWKNFTPLANGDWLISSTQSGVNGILLYDHTDNSISSVFANSYDWKYTQPLLNGDCLITSSISSYKNLYLYDHTTKNVSSIYSTTSVYRYFKLLPNGDCLIGTSTSNNPLLLFDHTNNSLSDIISAISSASIYRMKLLSNGLCLISPYRSESNSNYGVYLYDYRDKTINRPYTSFNSWTIFNELENGDCLISTTSSYFSNSGILFYDHTNNSIKKIYTNGYYFNIFLNMGNDCAISYTERSGTVTQSSQKGILIYDSDTKTITKKYDYSTNFDTVEQSGTNYIISNPSVAVETRLLYNPTTKDLTRQSIIYKVV